MNVETLNFQLKDLPLRQYLDDVTTSAIHNHDDGNGYSNSTIVGLGRYITNYLFSLAMTTATTAKGSAVVLIPKKWYVVKKNVILFYLLHLYPSAMGKRAGPATQQRQGLQEPEQQRQRASA